MFAHELFERRFKTFLMIATKMLRKRNDETLKK